MKQSRNLTRSVKELESLYEQVLEESTTPAGFEQEKSVSDDLEPKNSGPEGIDNDIDDPIENDVTDVTVKEGRQEDSDEETEEGDSDDEEKSSESAQNNENTEKTNISNINTNMSDKNIFDKLYSTIMEADDELGDALDVDFGGEEELDDLGDVGGEVTITLTQDQVDVLKDVLGQLEGDEAGDDAELEDLDGGGDLEDENPFPEGVEAETTNDGMTPGQDPSGLTGNNNKVGGEAGKTKSGGASAASSGQEDGGKPKNLPDTVSKMTSTGDNKVAGEVKGGNQGLLT